MRTFLLLSWLSLPIGGVAYHYGPGQERLQFDEVARLVAAAEQAAADADWHAASDRYGAALRTLPPGHQPTAWRLRLEQAKAQMNDSALPAAAADLSTLVDEIEATDGAEATVAADARRALASAQFYMTWLLRLEGKSRAEWEPQVEAARQNYRRLAELAPDADSARDRRADLEATIRLARLQIEDLQGLPLPSQ